MLENDDMAVWDAPEDEGDDAPRGSYNFAPGYHGLVYRADVSDHGAGPPRQRAADADGTTAPPDDAADQDSAAAAAAAQEAPPPPRFILSTMKWGLVPFWTKRRPDYATVLRTINCRDDSLATPGGMWASMKGRKRCVVIAQGFYEWLQTGPKERVPHYIRRRDGGLLLLAGLWDVVRYEDDDGGGGGDGAAARRHYTYTIITTDSSAPLKFLHDRMPVVLDPGSAELRAWLDPGRYEWSRELQAMLRPWDGELDIYAVTKEVNKVGRSSPNFIVPVASRENKNNIANFFANAKAKQPPAKAKMGVKPEVEIETAPTGTAEVKSVDEVARAADDGGMTTDATSSRGVKREAVSTAGSPPRKLAKTTIPSKASPAKSATGGRTKISATSNGTKSPSKLKQDGSQKITKFFANSA